MRIHTILSTALVLIIPMIVVYGQQKTSSLPTGAEVEDAYTSKGITHRVYRQYFRKIPIWNSHFATHTNGKSTHVSRGFWVDRPENVRFVDGQGQSLRELVKLLLQRYVESPVTPALDSWKPLEATGIWNRVLLPDVLHEPLLWQETWYPIHKTQYQKALAIAIDAKGSAGWHLYIIDQTDGTLLHDESWTINCNHDHNETTHSCSKLSPPGLSNMVMLDSFSYNVYPWPVESPNYGIRAIVNKPWLDNMAASPQGWHETLLSATTYSRGNNVDAYLDTDNNNSPTGGNASRVNGGDSLIFDFPLVAGSNPTAYQEAAVTNAFYWTNIIHDVLVNYGFDEGSGNFQVSQYSGEGLGNDYIKAEIQDGSGTCNANFGTPPEGNTPRMQIYVCNQRDGAYDNGVIAHEIGHGLSIRLTGGRFNSSCLNNQEQMGEGWSDWLGYILTIEPGDTGTDARGIGTFLFGQGPNGNGIRPYKYTTDMSVNPMTYDDIKTVSVPHGVGSVWATMLWDLSWNLIDLYGFDPDIYDGSGGNNMAMELVIEGMKLQPCRPGFVDGRDAIIAADSLIYGGLHHRLIWETFARRGLGFSANQGSSGSRADGSEAFDLPPYLGIQSTLQVDKVAIRPGESLSHIHKIGNNFLSDKTNITIDQFIPLHTQLISQSSGSLMGDTLMELLPLLVSQDSHVVTYVIDIDPDYPLDRSDFYERGTPGQTLMTQQSSGSTAWSQITESGSTDTVWFAPDNNSFGLANLDTKVNLGVNSASQLSFTHRFNTEAFWDGGQVLISSDNGKSWVDAGPYFIANGYNSYIDNSTASPAFSGNSQGYQKSTIDLSSFGGTNIKVRFQMYCDAFVGGEGWYIDDIIVTDIQPVINSRAQVTYDNLTIQSEPSPSTRVLIPEDRLWATLDVVPIRCHQDNDAMIAIRYYNHQRPEQILWSNGASTDTIQNLGPGIYSVTLIKGIDTLILVRDLEDPPLLESTIETVQGVSGNAWSHVNNTGGIMPYDYLWNVGVENDTITDLDPGVYIITITDRNGCTIIDTTTIVYDTCTNQPIELVIDLDQYPFETGYTLLNDLGDTVALVENFEVLMPIEKYVQTICLDTGCYQLVVNDTYGDGLCGPNSDPQGNISIYDIHRDRILLETCMFGVTDTFDFCVTDIEFTLGCVPLTCDGAGDDGRAYIDIIGGAGSVLWSTGETTDTISSLTSGTYFVTVTNANWSVTDSITIQQIGNSVVGHRLDNHHSSLRSTILNACDGDTITFASHLQGERHLLTNGNITLNKNLTILGDTVSMSWISGMHLSPIFKVNPSVSVELSDLHLTNGFDTIKGGMIHNLGFLHLHNMKLKHGYTGQLKTPMYNDGFMQAVNQVEMQY